MMTSDQKTLVPSLIKFINSDLFTFKNISSSVTLVANEPDIEGNDLSKWDVVISQLPLKFFDIINSIDDISTTENFDLKYVCGAQL